jgi:2-C-methyl-D-erythritol 2,4-cyclodiphosphate synthase
VENNLKPERVGMGFDAHPFVKGRPLVLGGVNIPHRFGLDGHSDADVLCHAVADSLLGALALGDIGKHFPSTDERWRGASSLDLLSRVVKMVAVNGYAPVNVDATVVAQVPHLAPHIEEMRSKLCSVLSLKPAMVSVKATTTDHLGFCGREEGIAAYAVTLLRPLSGSSD